MGRPKLCTVGSPVASHDVYIRVRTGPGESWKLKLEFPDLEYHRILF